MRHTLRLHGIVVGWSDLEDAEPDLGRARGEFRPGLGYDLVQPVFALFAEAVDAAGESRDHAALERYHRSRDALQLELLDDGGNVVRTSAIHIHDLGAAGRELDVLIPDEAYWARRAGWQAN